MGGFKKILKKVVGSVGRVLGLAPTPQPIIPTIRQSSGADEAQQALLREQAESERQRREEAERKAAESRAKVEEEARLAEERKKALAAHEESRKAHIASSGRASTILAGEGYNQGGKTLLGG